MVQFLLKKSCIGGGLLCAKLAIETTCGSYTTTMPLLVHTQ